MTLAGVQTEISPEPISKSSEASFQLPAGSSASITIIPEALTTIVRVQFASSNVAEAQAKFLSINDEPLATPFIDPNSDVSATF